MGIFCSKRLTLLLIQNVSMATSSCIVSSFQWSSISTFSINTCTTTFPTVRLLQATRINKMSDFRSALNRGEYDKEDDLLLGPQEQLDVSLAMFSPAPSPQTFMTSPTFPQTTSSSQIALPSTARASSLASNQQQHQMPFAIRHSPFAKRHGPQKTTPPQQLIFLVICFNNNNNNKTRTKKQITQ